MFKSLKSCVPLIAAILAGWATAYAPAAHATESSSELASSFSPAEFEEPTGTLTLRDALTLALVNSPALAPWSIEIKIAEAVALQAGLRPNPEFGAEIENFGGTGEFGGVGGAEATIALSQLIEFGGKRTKRRAAAEQNRNLAVWDYEIARMNVLTETANDFVGLLAAQEDRALAEELTKVAEEVLASVARRVKAGATSPVEESRARVELEMSQIERTGAVREVNAARVELAANWGSAAPMFEAAVGDLEQIPPVPSREELRSAVETSPSLTRWSAEFDRRQAELDLARAEGSIDVSVGAGVRYFNDVDDAAFLVEFGLPLRFFDRNQGASQAAALRMRQAGEERRAAKVRLLKRLSRTHEMLLAAEDEVTALRDRALPEATKAFEAAQSTYLRGSLRFTDVLDTERMLFELKGRYFDALVRYHNAVSELERLTGAPLESARDHAGDPDND